MASQYGSAVYFKAGCSHGGIYAPRRRSYTCLREDSGCSVIASKTSFRDKSSPQDVSRVSRGATAIGMSLARRAFVGLIRLYQHTLSLDHGPFRALRPHGQCKYHPTCSMYALQVIERLGVWRGGFLTMKRIARCHPWAVGGVDDPPSA